MGRGMAIIVVGILLKCDMVDAFCTLPSSVKCEQFLYQSSLSIASTSRTTGRRRARSHSSSSSFSNPFITSNPSSNQNEIKTPTYLPKVFGALAAIMLSISTMTTLDVNRMMTSSSIDKNINVVVVSSTEQPETWDEISKQSQIIIQQQQGLDFITTSTITKNLDQRDESTSKNRIDESKQYDYYLKLCLAGGFASCLAHGLLTPLDMIKTRMQSSSSSSSTNNPLLFAKELCQTEGPMSLLKGFQSTAMGYLLGGAVFFGGTEFFTQHLFQNSDTSFTFVLLCGAISVVMADIFVAPFEAMRIHTVTEETNNNENEVLQLKSITPTKEEQDSDNALHLSGLYTGFPALVIRDVPFHSTKFAVYDALSQQMHTILMDSMMTTIVAGAIAGIAAAVVSQPADAAFTQCCTSHSQQISPMDAFITVWQNGTISNGLLSRCVFGAMLVTLQFTLYSSAKHVLFG